MNIVYLIEFLIEEVPNKYIGSKSKCNVVEGKLYGERGLYEGSSKDPKYISLLNKNTPYNLTILGEFEEYSDALKYESLCQKERNVVKSSEYFNKSIANEKSTFTNPDYITVKNVNSGKTIRLNKNDPDLSTGEWVGVTKGNSHSEQFKKKIKRFGKDNHFYGKKHTKETKEKISEKIKKFYSSEESIECKKIASERMKEFSRKKRSEEHKRKIGIGNKGKITLKNINTGEVIRIPKSQIILYDTNIWLNPSKISQKRDTCRICGKISTVGNIVRWHNEKCKYGEINES